MKILVFEYITGGGMGNEPLPLSLAAEGDLMLGALVADLGLCPGVNLRVPRDARLDVPDAWREMGGPQVVTMDAGADLFSHFEALARDCDAVWPIAPETAGILERLCGAVEGMGKILLNSSSAAVRLAASKVATVARLCEAEVPVVPTFFFRDFVPMAPATPGLDGSAPAIQRTEDRRQRTDNEGHTSFCLLEQMPQPSLQGRIHGGSRSKPPRPGPVLPVPTVPTALGPWVVKPDDGAGCEGCRIVSDRRALIDLAQTPQADGMIVQPLLEGDALSLSALFHNGRGRLLACNRQFIVRDERGFRLAGCAVNAISDSSGTWQAWIDRIAAAVPELWGYAGVDLIMTEEGPRVLEINPRLTSSYGGLRAALGFNVAAWIVDMVHNGIPSAPGAKRGQCVTISFDGKVNA